MRPTQEHRCPNCGRVLFVPSPYWCGCNPEAPFRMVPATVTRAVDAVLGPEKRDEIREAGVRRRRRAT